MQKVRDIVIIAAGVAIIFYCLGQRGVGRYLPVVVGASMDTRTGTMYIGEAYTSDDRVVQTVK